MNSSPPYSPTKSLSGITLSKSRAKSMINWSPAECPMVSFAVFRLFRSNMMQTVGSTYPALTTVLSYVSLLQFFLNNFPQQIPFHLPIDDSIFERNHSKKVEFFLQRSMTTQNINIASDLECLLLDGQMGVHFCR